MKWKGYDDSYNKWVKEGQLECDEMLEEFELNHKRSKVSLQKRNNKKKSSHSSQSLKSNKRKRVRFDETDDVDQAEPLYYASSSNDDSFTIHPCSVEKNVQ